MTPALWFRVTKKGLAFSVEFLRRYNFLYKATPARAGGQDIY
jgi:hypothetical protein